MGKLSECTSSVAGLHWLAEGESVVLQIYSTNHASIFLGVCHKGQLKSLSISQFGLAPHFRQVPVGIYNTFRTRSSLSTALTLNASTTYLNDMIFFFFHYSEHLYKARHMAGLSMTSSHSVIA